MINKKETEQSFEEIPSEFQLMNENFRFLSDSCGVLIGNGCELIEIAVNWSRWHGNEFKGKHWWHHTPGKPWQMTHFTSSQLKKVSHIKRGVKNKF